MDGFNQKLGNVIKTLPHGFYNIIISIWTHRLYMYAWDVTSFLPEMLAMLGELIHSDDNNLIKQGIAKAPATQPQLLRTDSSEHVLALYGLSQHSDCSEC